MIATLGHEAQAAAARGEEGGGAMKLVAVASVEEEWRTSTHRRQRPLGGRPRVSYGRACLWIKPACGHYPVQRMVTLDKSGNFVAPARVRCPDC